MNKKIKKHLPRLDSSAYIGQKHVSFTSNCNNRKKLFIQRSNVDVATQLLNENLKLFNCECLVYVFMPDHVHMILHGLDDRSNILKCHNNWKGESGKRLAELNSDSFLSRPECGITNIWQRQSYDHVLRSYEYERGVLRKMIQYILENPVRADLVDSWQDYPFLGSLIGSYDVRHPYWWDWFYK